MRSDSGGLPKQPTITECDEQLFSSSPWQELISSHKAEESRCKELGKAMPDELTADCKTPEDVALLACPTLASVHLPTRRLNIDIWFADPYAPWQRGFVGGDLAPDMAATGHKAHGFQTSPWFFKAHATCSRTSAEG